MNFFLFFSLFFSKNKKDKKLSAENIIKNLILQQKNCLKFIINLDYKNTSFLIKFKIWDHINQFLLSIQSISTNLLLEYNNIINISNISNMTIRGEGRI